MITRYENAAAAAAAVPSSVIKRTCHRALKRLGLSWFKQAIPEEDSNIWSRKYMVCGAFKGRVICTGVGTSIENAWQNLLQGIFYTTDTGSLSEFFIKVDVDGIPIKYKQAMAQAKDVKKTI